MYVELHATENWWYRLNVEHCGEGKKKRRKRDKKETTGGKKRKRKWRVGGEPHTRVSMRGANGSGARVASNFSLLSSEMTLQI